MEDLTPYELSLFVDGYVKDREEQWNMAKFQAYSNYASIMASQGVTPATYEKWNNPEANKPIDTNANSEEIIAAFTAKMNEEAKRNRKPEQ